MNGDTVIQQAVAVASQPWSWVVVGVLALRFFPLTTVGAVVVALALLLERYLFAVVAVAGLVLLRGWWVDLNRQHDAEDERRRREDAEWKRWEERQEEEIIRVARQYGAPASKCSSRRREPTSSLTLAAGARPRS